MNRKLIEGLQKLIGELSRSSDESPLVKKHINNFIIDLLKKRFPDDQITLKQIIQTIETEGNHDEGPSSKNR